MSKLSDVRRLITVSHCRRKGWSTSVEDLTIEQIIEVRNLPEYIKAPLLLQDSKKEVILNRISDLCSNFLYSDRQTDEQLSMDQLNESVANHIITVDEMVAAFRKHLENTFNDNGYNTINQGNENN